MALQSTRLDRFLRTTLHLKRREVQGLLAAGRVQVDRVRATRHDLLINAFSHVQVDQHILQARQPRYFMLHKPKGLISATRDDAQATVMSLLHPADRNGLHIAGRLDKFSSGLLLLSDDSRWTQIGMNPVAKVEKRYWVQVQHPIALCCVDAFAQGIYFEHENIWTRPAHLELLAPCIARVTLQEGRYHQIKRMFGRFRNPVLHLHRERIGALYLDPTMPPGTYRALSLDEIHQAVAPVSSQGKIKCSTIGDETGISLLNSGKSSHFRGVLGASK